MLITLAQNQMNFFVLDFQERAGAGEYYLMEFESQVTKAKYRVFPTLVETNERYIKFAVELTGYDPSPLEGITKLAPPGSWEYRIWITGEQVLNPLSKLLVASGLMKLEKACEEVPYYTYISNNENASTLVYLSRDCSDVCLSYTSGSYWELINQTWDCEESCAVFGEDSDEFDNDYQYFIECKE